MATLTSSYQARYEQVRARVSTAAARAWDRLGSWDEKDVERFLTQILPVVEAGQGATAQLADAYLAAYVAGVTGVPTPPVGLDAVDFTDETLRGVPATEVYRRPFVTVWTSLKNGTSWSDAVNAGRARVESTANVDIALSMRAASVAAGEAHGVHGWRRVPDGKACEFCILASTQRYHGQQLMPLHNNCGCTVAPIVGSHDPGHVIDRQLLSKAKQLDPSAARDVRVQGLHSFLEQRTGGPFSQTVEHHGELGPVLVNAEQHFDSPN